MELNYNDKKEIFSELRDKLYSQMFLPIGYNTPVGVKISILNHKLIEEIKNLKVIELNNLEDFSLYVNYDHFLIFKFNNEFYFCDTALAPSLNIDSMIKIIDFNLYLRKDKIKKIDDI
jgi:hypothetical protein